LKRLLSKTLYILFLIFLFLGTLTFFPVGKRDPDLEMDIYLVSNDIHFGAMLPIKNDVFDWIRFIKNKDFDSAVASWIQIGRSDSA
jgi:hypothetical protein